MSITNKRSDTDTQTSDAFLTLVRGYAKGTHSGGYETVHSIGGFASVEKKGNCFVGASADGVGTKVRMATELNKLSVVGEDLVAMNANDLCVTMEPEASFMLDYYAVHALSIQSADVLMRGIAQGCRLAGAKLLGGETAEMPLTIKQHECELAGFMFGISFSDDAVMYPKRDICAGMGVFGFPSSGVHANGFSLIHKAFGIDYEYPNNARKRLSAFHDDLDRTLGEALMTPTMIYTTKISCLRQKYDIAGFAHVTGGGLRRNISRILPENCNAQICKGSWLRPPIFDIIMKAGAVSEEKMRHTFNDGIGIVAVSPDDLTQAGAFHIGDVVAGDGGVEYVE